jgi:hypothetical protein
MLCQQALIDKTIELCHSDSRFVAVMQAGSFTEGEGDRWSDIDFWLCVDDQALARLDRRAWISQIAPLLACFQNEFGTDVPIFEGLTRGEFHFAPASQMAEVRTWPFRAKCAAEDLTRATFRRYVGTSARLDEGDLRRAYREAWGWYVELAEELSNRFQTDRRGLLIDAIRRRVEELE